MVIINVVYMFVGGISVKMFTAATTCCRFVIPVVEKDVIRHSLTKFLVVSDITSADLFKAPLKDVILNAGKFHVFAGSPDTV